MSEFNGVHGYEEHDLGEGVMGVHGDGSGITGEVTGP